MKGRYITMGKKKSKKKKMSKEEKSVLDQIDYDIISQYNSIKEDTERFQYQLNKADRKTKKKYKKAVKEGKAFDMKNSKSVKKRKKIIKEMEERGFFARIMRLIEDCRPIIKLLSRCVGLLIAAILSVDLVKQTASKDTLSKMDKIFNIVMAV